MGKRNADDRDTAERDELVWTHGIDLVWEENIVENDDGTIGIEGLIQEERRKRRQKGKSKLTGNYKRGMIRHTVLVVDLSEAMDDTDLKPSRLIVTMGALVRFVGDFFHHNPISDMGLVVIREGVAHVISDLSGDKDLLISYIQKLADPKSKYFPAGEASLQNALNVSSKLLKGVPSHATKEVVMVLANLASCDPGNIYETIEQLTKERVLVNIVALAAAVRVCEDICKKTKGIHSVALDEQHVSELLLEHSTPPLASNDLKCTQLPVGFATFDSSHPIIRRKGKSVTTTMNGYCCPRCKNKVPSIPSKCDVCDLILVSSPHLAKTYHHLFPLSAFDEVKLKSKEDSSSTENGKEEKEDSGNDLDLDHDGESIVCVACEESMKKDTHAYKCPKCNGLFCFACDLFLHEELFNCPKCI